MTAVVNHDSQPTPGTPGGSAAAGQQPALISFRNVGQVFTVAGDRTGFAQRARSKEIVALENVNLEIPAGQFVALVGASGCGKTTLLNMLAGLRHPTQGEITMDGKAPTLPNMDVGYMFARDALLPWRSARKNVELPLETRGWSAARRRERSNEMLELVGLKGRESQYRLQLSQGMRQRVALARTLAADPSILLMDEPFAALDARTKLTLQAEFLRIWEQHQGSDRRKTVIFVTHDLQEAVALADRVVVMLPNPGRVAEDRVVDLPRPRANDLGEVMYTDAFKKTAHDLFERLEGAIQRNGPGGGEH
ncbi:MAG TPA: ABC transporter ATP-binding protein [Jatrophihabitantaceae bacterium]|nr:ABC transporter ATP-binding protein [Jatrophihabitantaceae bacterium]